MMLDRRGPVETGLSHDDRTDGDASSGLGREAHRGAVPDGYRILRNNEYGLVAAFAIAQIEKDQQQPTVGAFTVVIDKGTGEVWLSTIMAGQSSVVNQSVNGTCLRD
jgi:hypothetical protein